jgi:dihydroxy-acid dehydratase
VARQDVTIQDVFEGIGAHAAGDLTDDELTDLEDHASPGAGACGGQFTANTMAMASRCSASRRWAARWCPAEDGKKGKVAEECGPARRRGAEARTAARAGSSRSARSRTRSPPGATSGGSTNLVLHLLAVAHEAGSS